MLCFLIFATFRFLLCFQSCAASQYLEELMFKALVDPTTSQQAALFHQQRVLLANDITTNVSRGPTIKSIHDVLNENSVVSIFRCFSKCQTFCQCFSKTSELVYPHITSIISFIIYLGLAKVNDFSFTYGSAKRSPSKL